MDTGKLQLGPRYAECRIERIDCPDGDIPPLFKGDYDAWDHVVIMARSGSSLHRKALACVTSEERGRIYGMCGSW